MRFHYVLERLERTGAFATGEDADTAIRVTMEVLGEQLPALDVEPIAHALPPELAEPLRRGSHREKFGAEELYRRVSERAGIEPAIAREQVQVVCRELAELLTGEARDHLTLHAPADLAALFEPSSHAWPAGDRPPREHPRPRRSRGIFEARAGSRHPVSESRPHGQHHSVAENEDPHADRKLSSGKTAAEEEGETFSQGKRGSRRPLADGQS